MKCPRCRKPRDILEWVPLMQIEEFVEETSPIYKCPSCRWVFAPADRPRPLLLEQEPTS